MAQQRQRPAKASAIARRQTGLRLPEDTLRSLAIRAAELGTPKWKLANAILLRALRSPEK